MEFCVLIDAGQDRNCGTEIQNKAQGILHRISAAGCPVWTIFLPIQLPGNEFWETADDELCACHHGKDQDKVLDLCLKAGKF